MRALAVLIGVVLLQPLLRPVQAVDQTGWLTYRDPQGRFAFSYPTTFGTVEAGTDSGYGDRAAAVRFSGLTGLGGEAVLTTGLVSVDLQALGGLYDPIALQIFRAADVPAVRAAVPAATEDNFCQLLAEADHLGASPSLSASLLAGAREVDRMRNIDPAVVACGPQGEAVMFHKTATYQAGAVSARQHIFGAIRFLTGRYSSFQLVRASTTPPDGESLTVLARVIGSLQVVR